MDTCVRYAVAGQMGAGKTTLCSALSAHLNVPMLSVSDYLKEVVSTLWGLECKDRAKLQAVGAAMRSIDPNVWINHLMRICPGSCVIEGLRYQNEMEIVKQNGFKLILLTAPQELRRVRVNARRNAFDHFDVAHESEQLNIDAHFFDYVFDTSIMSIDNIIEEHFKGP